MTIDLIRKTQKGDSTAVLTLIEKFNPLLKKYAYKLHYEDAYNDLLVDFISLIHHIPIDQIHNQSEGCIVSYLSASIHNHYVNKLIKVRNLHNLLLYSELTEEQRYYTEGLSSTSDQYFQDELRGNSSQLNENERSIIQMIYYLGYSVTETAVVYQISRQAVNQMKNRALKKLKALVRG